MITGWSRAACCMLNKFRSVQGCLGAPLKTRCLFVESFVRGRTLSLAASPTLPSVPSVVERATSPLTASTPGDVRVWSFCTLLFPTTRLLTVWLFVLCSTFAAQRAPGAEPPQSAQDKARMDKEYLSLMAELGEAPIPSSGGGHSGTQAGALRASGPNSNQPPPVSLKPKRSRSCRKSWKVTSACYVVQNRPPWMSSGPAENRNFQGMHGGPTGPGGPHNFPPPMPSMGGPPMPPNPNGLPPPWMQPPPPPMGQGPGPHGHPMGKKGHWWVGL